MSDAEIVRNALAVAWSMPDAVLEHTDPRFKWWDGPLREAIDAAKPALARLESQNQALQEERDLAEAQRDVALRRRETLRENWMEALRRAEALQERAEKAEAALREIEAGPYNGFEQCRAIARAALSPTQETDPE